MKEMIEGALERVRAAEGALREGRGKLGHYETEQRGEDTTEFELNRWEAERLIVPRLDSALSHLARALEDLDWAREEWEKIPPPPKKKKTP